MPAPPAHQRIYEHLRGQIIAGEFTPPNDKLPTQRELAATFHCSLQPVKQALQRLEFEGLIESRQGVGAFAVARS